VFLLQYFDTLVLFQDTRRYGALPERQWFLLNPTRINKLRR